MIKAEFLANKVVIWDIKEGEKIHNNKYFGKWIEEENNTKYLQLSLTEAMYLLEKGKIRVYEKDKEHDVSSFYELCSLVDKEFPQKFAVFRDLRNRGYIVKSGFKFGTHFRVYDKGVNPYKKGQKEKGEHTKYNVHAVPENHTLSYHEWSRYVRLSHNIRAQALLAVVDEEGDITYYSIQRVRP